MKEDAFWIREQVKAHNKWFEESLPMIASENVMSPLAKEMMVSDFHDRYAEGLPGKRYYMGNIYVDRVELKCLELARKIFDCQFADVRPTSGTVANIAVLFALIKPGDLVSCSALAQGAHISTAKFGAFGIRGVRSINYPFNEDDMNIDIDGTRKVLLEHRPKVCQFGLSVFLFPTPLRELEDTFHEIDATVWYDAAHVLGLIAGKRFQDPFREGCDVISASTHKTFPGPNHGILLAHNIDDELEKNLQRAAFPGVTSSHHLHAMAALAITLAEQEVFAEQYADQVIRNAKALGEALFELGMGVLCPHKGFTESHTIAVDVSEHGGGVIASSDLEESNIITNKNLLPGDMSAVKPSGIRLGSQELTRVGMKESEMKEVADLIYRVVAKKENPKLVREDVKALKKDFTTVKYCFTEGGAYDYHDFV
ncbi:MAG TPA: serine hydroxymethyltransferase [Methanomassiliicoccales archaeon]|nr:serine hydroxymethyltransferase [Methanomassiliicoccales archaeon]